MKIWQNGEFTEEANAVMFGLSWIIAILGIIAGLN